MQILKRLADTFSTLFGALLLTSCAALPTSAESAHDYFEDADPALFKLSDDDTTIYLFGTFHMLDDKTVWFDDAVADAFAASDRLVLEAVMPEPAKLQATFLARAFDMQGEPLDKELGPEAWGRLKAQLDAFDEPVEPYMPMDPWFAAISLVKLQFEKLGYSPANGAESILRAAAEKRGIPIEGLETLDSQLELFDSLPPHAQVTFLMQAVDELETAETEVADLSNLWRRGDIASFAEHTNKGMEEDPALFRRVFNDRNANWADSIAKMMETPGTTFVAVGAGHLGGKDNVQEKLAERGFTVTRVAY